MAAEWGGEGKFPAEQRDDGFEEHGPQFPRRAGQKNEAFFAGNSVQGQAGGGAVGIGENRCALRDHGLDWNRGGHGTTAHGKVMPDAGKGGRVADQFSAEDLRGGIAGDVVAGGTETAGGEDQSARASESRRASWICRASSGTQIWRETS